ncbi:ESPR-type extended signal peptide-containing protein [Dialister invisus]|uniref:ESPR-type extended signal peptide-containing protein n=4 Tax=Dialister invisus TaxID=218538 RepID=UPI003520423E
MNQIYKVIWSRVKHCYVVVSEIAGRCGKNGGTASEKKSMPVRAFLCALAVTGCLLPGIVEASFDGGIGASTATANSIAVGDDAKTTEEYTIALGSRSRAINIYAIAMGDQAQATGQGATAIGSLSKSTAEHSLAVGDQAEAAAVNSSAYGILSKALSSHSVAIGNGASVGKGDPDSVSSQNGIAIGNGANVTVNPATATPGITDKSGGIAIGHDATTKDINTIALGTGTVGQGAQAVAIGRNARTIANNGVAIGNEARTQSTNGFALGNNARAGFDENNVLVGRDNDQAFGSNARAWGGSSMAFGNNAKAANGGAIAMGNGSQSRGDWGVAIGNGAKALAAGARALGANSTAKGVNSTAIGWDSKSEADRGIAIGETASVEDGTEHGIAIGTGAKASGKGSTGTPSLPASTVAIGQGAQALENGDIVIGRQAKSIASTEHGNPGSGAVVAGAEAAAYGARGDVVIGASAETNVKIKQSGGTVDPKYAQGVAIGSTAKTYGTQSLALGSDTRAIGNSSIAIGGDDIDMARTELETAVPQLKAGNGIKKSFNKEIETKFPGGLGSASINVKGKYANTAAIGDATTAIGTLSEAFGTGSTAIGINSLTKGVASTGIGIMARSWGDNSLALGTQVGAYGTRSSSIGDTNQVGLDMKDGNKSGKESAAVGSQNTIYGNQAYAVGAGNTIGSATVNTATETNGSAAGADQDKITTVTAGTVKGNMAGAFGYKNTINADNAYTVGSNSTVSADGAMVLGNNASVTAKNGMALGSNTKVANENAVALGAGSETAAAVATLSATINGTAHNFAGINPASTVSVGKAGSERTITNVAAGRISATSTDAINGSQLYAVTTEMDKGVAYAGDVKAAAAAANKFIRKLGEQTNIVGGVADASKLTDGNIGVVSNGTDTLNIKLAKNVKVDSVTAGNTVINNNGLTVGGNTYVTNNGLNANNQTITNVASGGNTTTNAANIGDVQTAVNNAVTNVTNTLTAKGLDFEGNDGAVNKVHRDLGTKLTVKGGLADVTTGVSGKNLGVKKNAAGDGLDLVMSEKPEFKEVTAGTGTNKVVINDNGVHVGGKTYINNSGLNANNQKITNVATGTAGTDAVNVDQLNAAIGGTAKATTVKAKDANVTVTKGTSAETGGREYTIGLGNVVTVGQTHPVTVNGDAGTVNGLTNTTWDIDNPQPVSGQAATEDQLKTVSDGVKTNKTDITNINTTIGKGLNFKGDDAAVINKKLGERLDIKGGADSSKLSDGNIGVVSGNGALNVKLAKDVKVDSVTTGNTVINNNGLTVGGKTYVTNNGINANNQKVTNVADGQVAAGSKDAVNGGQLHDAKNEVINKGLRFDADNNSEKTNKLGSKVTVNGDNNITTEITQTGEDTKIGVKLKEDIHVKTVTATDTVKAGGVTMGSQTSGGTTGNYVTGLDNKTWNVTNPTAVSGRAATEDQLKTVTEAINNQSAAATDYRLVQNASSADGSYTVDTNGNIDLTVEDKNHAGQKETVKLKDIASKSKLDDVIAKGLQFDANAGGTKTNKLGSKITVKGEGTAADTEYSGENLKTFITQDPAGNTTIDVKMNKNLKVETIVATGENGKDGKIGINGKDGVTTNISVTRDGKPGVDGAPGTTTTRIVYEKPDGTKEEVATLNDGMKYGGDTGNVIKKKLNEQVNVVGGITDENKLTTEDNLGVVSDGNNNLKVRLAKALKGLESITAGDTFINNNGITISNGAAGNTVSLTKDGLDNGGNKITNVAAGDVSANSTDAVNGSQLHDVKTLAGQHTTVKAKDSNITVTEGTNGTGGKEYTVGLGDKVTLGTDPSKQVSIDGTTGIIKAGDKVTIDGTTGNIDAGKVKINGKDGTVNGLTNKTWDPNNITSGQAATEDQLKAVDQKITNTSEELTKKGMDFAGNDGEFHRNLGDKVTIKGEGTKAASEYSGENIKTFADANGNLTVKMDKNLKTETIVATGKNGKDGKIGINGKDGVTTNISVTRDGKPGVDGAPGTTTTRIVYEKPDGTKEEVATLNDGMKYGGDTGNVIKKKLNEQVNVVGGITDENKLTTEDNLGVVSDGNNNLKVRMAKDLKGLNSVTTNTLTVGDVKIDNSGINAGNKKITNVAAGDISANSTDAVNGGQLWKTNQTINNIGGVVNELGDRMDRVGAGAAALAALHPLDFDPDDKWDVAAGYGNYKDAHAVAVGAFYRPNEDTMFSVGGSFGGGENMVNAGVSVKLGQGNHVSTSKVAMAKEIVDLRDENKDLKKRLDTMEQKMNSILGILDMGKKKDFPDVPENHWAYEYVSTLAGNGILEGYPDGMFSGERSMTRYEFAAMFYRALKNGAPVDDNMDRAMNEFEPELRQIRLDRIRVDRISGKDNDRNKVERVRVNSEDDKANNDYRDVYGSHISPEA